MKQVIIPLDEYEELIQDSKDKKQLLEKLEADAKDRGFFVQMATHVWSKDGHVFTNDYEYIQEKNTLKIISKDEVMSKAQEEIDRLSDLCENLEKENRMLTEEIQNLKLRGFYARLFNK